MLQKICLTIGMLLFILMVLEGSSVMPYYEPTSVTIIEIQNNSKTLVEFDDKFRDHYSGDLGEVGDVIIVKRQAGLQSLFGIITGRTFDFKGY